MATPMGKYCLRRVTYLLATVALLSIMIVVPFSPVSAQIQIKDSELASMLGNPETVEEALSKYFEVDGSAPFTQQYVLRPDVEVLVDPSEERLSIGSGVIGIANSLSRKLRIHRYNEALRQGLTPIVSEGDSWFQHPRVKDVIDHLSGYFAVYSLGAAGDEVSNMFSEAEYLAALQSQEAKVLLLSGGGNDLLGGRFGDYLNQYLPGQQASNLINDEFYIKLAQVINVYRSTYEMLKLRNPEVTVITHGYDYVVPSGRWLGAPMAKKGITDPEIQRAIISTIINAFNSEMQKLADEYDNAIFIDVRNTVSETQWYDEIHPDSYGFQQVSLKFISEINKKTAH